MMIIMLRASSGADRLYAISTRPDSTAVGSVFKDSLSFSTVQSLHCQQSARRSMTTGRAVMHGFSAEVPNHRLTVVGPRYELTTVLRKRVTYALGRCGSARRDLHGQLSHSTL